jgi:hypothetical protein
MEENDKMQWRNARQVQQINDDFIGTNEADRIVAHGASDTT